MGVGESGEDRNTSDMMQADRHVLLSWEALKLMLGEIKENFPEEVALELSHKGCSMEVGIPS